MIGRLRVSRVLCVAASTIAIESAGTERPQFAYSSYVQNLVLKLLRHPQRIERFVNYRIVRRLRGEQTTFFVSNILAGTFFYFFLFPRPRVPQYVAIFFIRGCYWREYRVPSTEHWHSRRHYEKQEDGWRVSQFAICRLFVTLPTDWRLAADIRVYSVRSQWRRIRISRHRWRNESE